MHIIDPQSYLQAKWLNGKGETTQLMISPSDQDFKQQKFDYRISIATLNAELCQFSIFEPYNRWLILLEGGPVSVKNSSREETIQLEALQQVISFGGEEILSSISQKSGRDFNFFLRKGLKGEAKIHKLKDKTSIPISRGTHFFYNASNTPISIVKATEDLLIPSAALCSLSSQQASTLHLEPNDSSTLIHCTIEH